MARALDRRGTVWIAEQTEVDPYTGHEWLPGVFDASWQTERSVLDGLEGVSAAQAIGWGRERSDSVLIRLGVGDYYWAGIGEPQRDARMWPPPDLPPLVRRRHPRFAYLDRTMDDPPIAWVVTAWIGPAERRPNGAGVAAWEGLPATELDVVATAVGARWDDEAFLERAADRDRARRKAKRAGSAEYGWFSSGRDAYRLRLDVTASTATEAEREGSRALQRLRDDLRVEEMTVEPSR